MARRCQSARGTIWKGWRDSLLEDREQQLGSRRGRSVHSEQGEGGDGFECLLSAGQQLWREGEGSGLGAGDDPAGTTTAARDWRPEHAMTRWLTDQASSATIRTTPIDRLLAIAVSSMDPHAAGFCDSSHITKQFAKYFGPNAVRR